MISRTIIKNIRTLVGLTQEKFAEKVYVSEKTISAYEQGLRQPSLDFIFELLMKFDINMNININSNELERMLMVKLENNKTIKEKILKLIKEKRLSNDYIKSDFIDDFIEFDKCLEFYSELLSENIIDLIIEAKLDDANIKGFVHNDKSLSLYYIDETSATIIYLSEYIELGLDNISINKIKSRRTSEVEICPYIPNHYDDLWLYFLEKNIDIVSDNNLLESLEIAIEHKDYKIEDSELKKEINNYFTDERLCLEKLKVIINDEGYIVLYSDRLLDIYNKNNYEYNIETVSTSEVAFILNSGIVIMFKN